MVYQTYLFRLLRLPQATNKAFLCLLLFSCLKVWFTSPQLRHVIDSEIKAALFHSTALQTHCSVAMAMFVWKIDSCLFFRWSHISSSWAVTHFQGWCSKISGKWQDDFSKDITDITAQKKRAEAWHSHRSPGSPASPHKRPPTEHPRTACRDRGPGPGCHATIVTWVSHVPTPGAAASAKWPSNCTAMLRASCGTQDERMLCWSYPNVFFQWLLHAISNWNYGNYGNSGLTWC